MGKALRLCVHCDKPLPAGATKHRKYCSEVCSRRVNWANYLARKGKTGWTPQQVVCPICGTEFVQVSSRHMYCSRKCNAKAERQRRQKESCQLQFVKCAVCDKVFFQKMRKHTFCSTACYKRSIRNPGAKSRVSQTPTKHPCKWCGRLTEGMFCDRQDCQRKREPAGRAVLELAELCGI